MDNRVLADKIVFVHEGGKLELRDPAPADLFAETIYVPEFGGVNVYRVGRSVYSSNTQDVIVTLAFWTHWVPNGEGL